MNADTLAIIQQSYLNAFNENNDPMAWTHLEDAISPLRHISKGGLQNYDGVRQNLQVFLDSGVAEILVELCETPKTLLTCSCVETAEHILKMFIDVVEASQCASPMVAIHLERCTSPTPKCR